MPKNNPMDELKFTPTMKILNEEQLSSLHQATLEILERTGVAMTHPKALEILDGAGCRVDSNRVYFPPELVEKAIASAPKGV